MKQKLLFAGMFSIGLAFMLVLAGCGYDGPSVDEISDAVINKQKPGPSADDIAETALDKGELREHSKKIEELASWGKLTVTKGIQAWGQTDAAYSLAVNTAERESFSLPDHNDLTWDGAGNADIKRTDNLISIEEKSNGKSASFNFTITNFVTEKTIKGSLTVTTSYDNSTVGVANLNEFFEKVLSSGLDDDSAVFATNTPITRWGQTDAAYTITAENDVSVNFPGIIAPIIFDSNSWNWKSALVEWKPPTVATGLTSQLYYGNNYNINIGNHSFYYPRSELYLSTDSTTERQASLSFRITNDDQTISGTVTVKIKKVVKTLTAAELEEAALKELQNVFFNSFFPSYSSYNAYILTSYAEKGITAFGQTDVSYLITVRGGRYDNDNYYDEESNEYIETGNYGYLELPYIYDNNYNNKITYNTKTANAAAVLDGSYLKVYENKSGAAEFNFTYTYSAAKTVKGSIKVTVVK